MTGQGNNATSTFSVALNSTEQMEKLNCQWCYHSGPMLNVYFHLLWKFSLLSSVKDPKFSILAVVCSVLIWFSLWLSP